MDLEYDSAPPEARPRTATVVGLLSAAAGVFSYLIAYALANALAAAEVIKPFTREHDPRPRWFLVTFCLLIICFAAFGALARHMSSKNLRQIELMEQEAEEQS